MSGKIIAGVIVVLSLIAGAAIYYLQVYAYYDAVMADGETAVQLTALVSGAPEPILYDGFEAITATSSPIRYRACFTTSQSIALLSDNRFHVYDFAFTC